MKLPASVLSKQFDVRLTRGTILRFEFNEWNDPAKVDPGPKFAVVLNNSNVTDPIYLALTTSKVGQYKQSNKHAGAVMLIAPGTYECFPIETAIMFRHDPVEVAREQLSGQIHVGKLTFVGDLTAADLARMDTIIIQSRALSPWLIELIKPL